MIEDSERRLSLALFSLISLGSSHSQTYTSSQLARVVLQRLSLSLSLSLSLGSSSTPHSTNMTSSTAKSRDRRTRQRRCYNTATIIKYTTTTTKTTTPLVLLLLATYTVPTTHARPHHTATTHTTSHAHTPTPPTLAADEQPLDLFTDASSGETLALPNATSAALPAPRRAAACDASRGMMRCLETGCADSCVAQAANSILVLLVAAMASHTFGSLLSGFGFPSITTFLLFGVVCGPYVTVMVTAADAEKLRWVNDVALGFIGLSAGGKLRLEEVRENWRAAASVLGGLVVVTYCGSIA